MTRTGAGRQETRGDRGMRGERRDGKKQSVPRHLHDDDRGGWDRLLSWMMATTRCQAQSSNNLGIGWSRSYEFIISVKSISLIIISGSSSLMFIASLVYFTACRDHVGNHENHLHANWDIGGILKFISRVKQLSRNVVFIGNKSKKWNILCVEMWSEWITGRYWYCCFFCVTTLQIKRLI